MGGIKPVSENDNAIIAQTFVKCVTNVNQENKRKNSTKIMMHVNVTNIQKRENIHINHHDGGRLYKS